MQVSAIDPCFCRRNYAPVCGNNGQTYPNRCEFDCAARQIPGLSFSVEISNYLFFIKF